MSSIENLKGRTILIGKEPVNGRLAVSVKINGQPKTAAVGELNSVPNTVSRCIPNENKAHCKIDVDAMGNMVVTNLKPQNVTYVNGAEIVSKKVNPDGFIGLGKDRFPVSVNTVVETASKLVEAVAPPTSKQQKEYPILHLKQVWDDYKAESIKLKKRTQELGIALGFPPILTLGSGAISAIVVGLGLGQICIVTVPMTVCGVVLMIRNHIRRKKDTSIEDGDRLVEDFQKKYICPNPECGHFLGNKSYDILCQDKGCPYCHCIFIK